MTITFKLELRDLYVFNGYIQKHSSARRRLRLFAFLFLAAPALFVATTIKDADTPEYIYIFATQYSAHVIPKRAFADAESAHRFHQYAAALHAAAMSRSPCSG